MSIPGFTIICMLATIAMSLDCKLSLNDFAWKSKDKMECQDSSNKHISFFSLLPGMEENFKNKVENCCKRLTICDGLQIFVSLSNNRSHFRIGNTGGDLNCLELDTVTNLICQYKEPERQSRANDFYKTLLTVPIESDELTDSNINQDDLLTHCKSANKATAFLSVLNNTNETVAKETVDVYNSLKGDILKSKEFKLLQSDLVMLKKDKISESNVLNMINATLDDLMSQQIKSDSLIRGSFDSINMNALKLLRSEFEMSRIGEQINETRLELVSIAKKLSATLVTNEDELIEQKINLEKTAESLRKDLSEMQMKQRYIHTTLDAKTKELQARFESLRKLLLNHIGSSVGTFEDKLENMQKDILIAAEQKFAQGDDVEQLKKDVSVLREDLTDKIEKVEEFGPFKSDYGKLSYAPDCVNNLEKHPCLCKNTEIECLTQQDMGSYGWVVIKCTHSGSNHAEINYRDVTTPGHTKCWEPLQRHNLKNFRMSFLRDDYIKHRQNLVPFSKNCREICVNSPIHNSRVVTRLNPKNGNLDVAVNCYCVPYMSECRVIYDIVNGELRLQAKAGFGYVQSSYIGIRINEIFSGHITISLGKISKGRTVASTMCNGRDFGQVFDYSVREYCDDTYSDRLWGVPSFICRNVFPFAFAIIGSLIYFCSPLLSAVLAVTVGTMRSMINFLLYFLTCKKCSRYMFLNHECNSTCVFCKRELINKSDSLDMSNSDLQVAHKQKCKLIKEKVGLLKRIRSLEKGLKPAIKGISSIIFLGTILYMVGYTRSEEIDQEFRSDKKLYQFLLNGSFKSYNLHDIPAHLSHYSPKLVKKEECDGNDCTVRYTLEGIVDGERGSGFSYKEAIEGKPDLQLNIQFRLMNQISTCRYEFLYETSNVYHKYISADTCSDDCEICLNQIKEVPLDRPVFNITLPGTSSWACNAPNCINIGSGCTCSKCWCNSNSETTWEVLGLTTEKFSVLVCVQISNEILCKNVENNQNDDIVKATLLESGQEVCPKRIAFNSKTNETRKGVISEKGDLSFKFGAVQINDDFTNYKDAKDYDMYCHFAEHRSVIVKSCCQNPFGFLDDLEDFPYLNMTGKNSFAVDSSNQGSKWSLKLNLPPINLKRNNRENKLSSVHFLNCVGCFDCDLHASCSFNVDSMFNDLLKVEATGDCSLSTKSIYVYSGANVAKITTICHKESNSIKLTFEGFPQSVKIDFKLKKSGKMPTWYKLLQEHDGYSKSTGCEKLLCGFFDLESTIMLYIEKILFLIVVSISVAIFIYVLCNTIIFNGKLWKVLIIFPFKKMGLGRKSIRDIEAMPLIEKPKSRITELKRHFSAEDSEFYGKLQEVNRPYRLDYSALGFKSNEKFLAMRELLEDGFGIPTLLSERPYNPSTVTIFPNQDGKTVIFKVMTMDGVVKYFKSGLRKSSD